MEFCPKCGSLMYPEKKDNNMVLVCRNCGFMKVVDRKKNDSYVIKSKIKHTPKDESVVVHQDVQTMPTLNVECPKCHNIGVYYWQVQTRSADEPPTTFYRCKKCGYTWREY
ncbi:MAG: transcription factor S [Candidatus Asgardarchaeia archaeon]